MKYICKKRLENILFWFVIIFAIFFLFFSYFGYLFSLLFESTKDSSNIERDFIFIVLAFFFGELWVLVIPVFVIYILFIWSTNLKTHIKWFLFNFVLLSFIFKILFMLFFAGGMVLFDLQWFVNINSLIIYFIFQQFHLVFLVFIVWYKIKTIVENKKNNKFFENIIKLENNDLFVSETKTTDKFMLFKNGDKKIFFNFENEEKNIKEQIKNILSTKKVKAKMNFKYQFIEKNISQSKFEIIFKSQKEKLKLTFDLYITSGDLILKRTTITKNQLLKEKLEFSLPETSHLLLTT